MAFANLAVVISGNISSLDAAVNKAVARVKTLGANLTSIGSTLSLGISAPLAAFAGIAVNSAANLEALKNGLTAVSGSAIEAGRQFSQLKEVAKLPGLGFEEAVRGATNLQAIGFQFAQSKNILLQFGNALASVGRGREDLEEVIRQLGQMASRGKVTADNLKPIIERVPQAASIIRREFGTIDTEQLQKLGISAKTMIDTLERELGKLPRVTGGLKNDIENFRDAVTFAFADAGNAIAPFAKKFLDEFAVPAVNMIPQLAKAFNDLSPALQGFSLGIVGVVAAVPLFITALGTVVSNFGVLTAAVGAIGWPAIVAGFGLATTAAIVFGSKLAEIAEIARSKFDTSMERSTKNNTHFNISLKATSKEWQGLAETTGRVSDGFKNTSKITEDLIASVDEMGKKAPAAVNSLGDTLAKNVQHVKAWKIANSSIFDPKVVEFYEIQDRQGRVVAKTLELQRQETEANIEAMARLALAGGRLDKAFELPSLEGSNVKLQDLADGFSSVEETARRAAEALKAVSLPSDLNKLSALQNKQRGDVFEDQFKSAVKNGEEAFKASATSAKKYAQQVSLIANDLGRNITDLIFKGGKLKDVLVGAFVEIGKGLLRSVLETQLKRVVGLLVDIATKAPSVQKALSAIFGLGGSAASGAASSASQAATGAAGAATSGASAGAKAASGAASGLLGTLGAVAQIGTLVSSIVGNFQFAGMNKSLDIIVKHTLQAANQLIFGIQPALNTYLPYLKLIHERSFETGFGTASSRPAPTINVNIYNPTIGPGTTQASVDSMFREAARRVALAGA